ncbi:NAD(P)-binding protein [Thozetella sp. PMI_491]|nr:NAD(P)-binding protein [Thozetella sp. PMI_491]
MSSMYSSYTQAFPPKPSFKENVAPDLQGKVCIVTGSNAGIGKHLSRMLYSKNATVYVAARSEAKANAAIDEIKAAVPKSAGSLTYLNLDLADLSTIRTSVDAFLCREQKLDVLFNNAGVMHIADDTRTKQGYEMNMGVNCLGTFLFTKLLTSTLINTAKSAPAGSVRVVWVSSSAAEFLGTKNTAVDLNNLEFKGDKPGMPRYGNSKAGNFLHAAEYAKRHRADGVISVALNPGNLASDLWHHHGSLSRLMMKPMLHPPVNGAYTLLFAGLSPAVTIQNTGAWVIPFGRIGRIRKDYELALKTESEGGNGAAARFWEWTEDQVRPFL